LTSTPYTEGKMSTQLDTVLRAVLVLNFFVLEILRRLP
jgi:hypothetical protein